MERDGDDCEELFGGADDGGANDSFDPNGSGSGSGSSDSNGDDSGGGDDRFDDGSFQAW